MGMTAIEKILARNSDQEVVKPGDLVVVEVGTAVLYDNNLIPANWRDVLSVKHPERVVMQAVKRMLPGNRLSRKQMTNLRVFAGAEHGMEAQKPEVLDVKSMNKKNTRSA